MRTKTLSIALIAFLVVIFVVIAPETTFARGFSYNGSVGSGTGSEGTAGSGSPTGAEGNGGIGNNGGGPAGAAGGGTGNNGGGPAGAAGGGIGNNGGGGPAGAAGNGGTGAGAAAGDAGSALGKLAPKVGQYGCYGVSCDNQDPAAMGCNKSRMTFAPFSVLDASGNVLATGQNVYSVGCNANWTEGTLTGPGRNIVILISATDSQGKGVGNCFPHDTTGICVQAGYNGATGWPAFSDMVDGTNVTKSVIQVTGPDDQQYLNSVTQ